MCREATKAETKDLFVKIFDKIKKLRLLHHRLAVEFLGQIGDDFFVDQRIDVLPELVEDEPVADLALVGDELDVFVRRESAAGAQQIQTDLRPEADGDSVHQRDARQNGQGDEPEPQEDEDLLVHDVEWQHTG